MRLFRKIKVRFVKFRHFRFADKAPLSPKAKRSAIPVVSAALQETKAAADTSKAQSVCMEADAVKGLVGEEFTERLWIQGFRMTRDMFN